MIYHGLLRQFGFEWDTWTLGSMEKLVALLVKALPRCLLVSKRKFLAWHRARLTPLVDLELDAHGVT